METKYETLLNEEIKNQIEEVGKEELGSESAKLTIDGTTKLMDRSIELRKLEIERENQTLKRNDDYELKCRELELKEREIKSEHKARIVDLAIKGFTAVGTLVVGVWGVLYTTAFEKDDTYTTSAAKSFVSGLFKFKK